ncbi:serine/threonine protein kinase [Scytonema hofmannii PCC 7110]|uniref:Serine/threonine protein kinase n=1 Tax=Scytonema hofmannii PCC 7110 TaxID=128403 RepID=A0A139XCV1_9CYAN|nr:AAA-like domain-containing protein [Scytonema hofmannii]KYC42520.1 serine/threonine protein kinase [Scytonema hofmannii PCC 7110]
MTLDSLLAIVNHKLLETQNRPLNDTETLILRGIWQSQTYSQMAQAGGYSPGYLTNVVAPGLCQKLSLIIGRRVTKKNCRALLEFYATAQAYQTITTSPRQLPTHIWTNKQKLPRFPSGSVPLDSPYYIQNTAIQEQAFAEISKPGALIRLEAPREMGKTSLLLRILEYAHHLGYRTVSLNLEEHLEGEILTDLNRFLRWLCANISLQLGLEPKLDDYWDWDLGSKVSCSLFLRNHVLEQTGSPIVLALDDVNHIFEYPQVAKEFFPLLRSWYEEAKRQPIWQKLRLIVIHSAEVYMPLQLHQSPFNVGLPIQLRNFNLAQVQQLSQNYGIDWADDNEVKFLTDMVGGHPALVHLALYHLSGGEISLTQLLEDAPTPVGIYYHHLQRHWAALQAQPKLASAFERVMHTTNPVSLESLLADKLSSMGLIKLENDRAIPSCQLYRQYFLRKFSSPSSQLSTPLNMKII